MQQESLGERRVLNINGSSYLGIPTDLVKKGFGCAGDSLRFRILPPELVGKYGTSAVILEKVESAPAGEVSVTPERATRKLHKEVKKGKKR